MKDCDRVVTMPRLSVTIARNNGSENPYKRIVSVHSADEIALMDE